MDFLKKAKSQMKELEGDLNKAMATIKVGDHGGSSSGASSAAAPTPSSGTTPAASSAPSVRSARPKSSVKLPLTVRKNLRDYYDPVKPDAEAKISASLGVPWTIDIDVGYVYEIAQQPATQSRQAKENMGRMLAEYVNTTAKRIGEYATKYGADGVEELNSLASMHAIVLEQADGPVNGKATADIHDGVLRLLFEKEYLGFNIDQGAVHLDKAVNAAGIAAGASGGAAGGPALSFEAKTSVKEHYDAKLPAVQAKLEKTLGLAPGSLTLHTDFAGIYPQVVAYVAEKKPTMGFRDWEKRFGATALGYFEGLSHQLDFAGFAKDDMLQEGFQEAVEENRVELRVVEKLVKRKYSEVVIEEGVLYLQTTPEHWGSNINQTGEGLVDLL